MDELETAIITKTGHGFDVTDNFGDVVGSFKNGDQVADMFRKRDFSEEYIAKRRADLNRNHHQDRRDQRLMCGRYGRRSDKQKIAEASHVKANLDDIDFMPNDEITPGTMQPVVFSNDEGERDLELMYWGLTFPKRLIFNTRTDSILKPGLWKNSFENRRCIVPADRFFEWKRLHKKNNPKYEITIPGHQPFALAGIWSMGKNKEGDSLPAVSVIT